jgi:hypothetical protein
MRLCNTKYLRYRVSLNIVFFFRTERASWADGTGAPHCHVLPGGARAVTSCGAHPSPTTRCQVPHRHQQSGGQKINSFNSWCLMWCPHICYHTLSSSSTTPTIRWADKSSGAVVSFFVPTYLQPRRQVPHRHRPDSQVGRKWLVSIADASCGAHPSPTGITRCQVPHRHQQSDRWAENKLVPGPVGRQCRNRLPLLARVRSGEV